jgi:drug/metabolite transporter (DMT)-like permease
MYWVLVKRDLGDYDQRTCFAVNSVYMAGGLLVAMFLFGNWRALAEVPLRLWVILAISAFVGLLFSHILLYRAIQAVGPVVANGATCVQPFITAVGAWAVLGEVLVPAQWAGGCVLAASSVVLLSLRLKANPASTPAADGAAPLPGGGITPEPVGVRPQEETV